MTPTIPPLPLESHQKSLERVEMAYQRVLDRSRHINELIATTPETAAAYHIFFGGLLRIDQLLSSIHLLEIEALHVSRERAVRIHNELKRNFSSMIPGESSSRRLTPEELLECDINSRLTIKLQTNIESIFLFLDILGDQVSVLLSHSFPGSSKTRLRTLDQLQSRSMCSNFFGSRSLAGFEIIFPVATNLDSKYRNQFVVHNGEPKYSLSPQGFEDPYLVISVFGGVSKKRDVDALTSPSIGIVNSFENHCHLVEAFFNVLELNLAHFRKLGSLL